MAKGRRPDFRLKAFEKATGRVAEVGAAWINPNTGSISISLNLFVTLEHREGVSLILFPIDEPENTTTSKQDGDNSQPQD